MGYRVQALITGALGGVAVSPDILLVRCCMQTFARKIIGMRKKKVNEFI
jgi:hypothetical protein